MSDEKTKDGTHAEIIYHFKVAQHKLPLTLSIETEQATKDILEDFNRQFFGGKLEYTLHVEPSEEGGYIKTIILTSIVVGGTGIFTIIAGDMTRSFIKGLTNNYHLDLSEEAGKKIGQYLNFIDDVDDDAVETDETSELSKEIEGEIISLIPLHLLSENIQNLEAAGITSYKFCKTFKARNKFYNTCIETEEVQGLSFNRSDNFSIKRDDFKNLRVDIPNSKYFKHDIIDIAVSSPNWKRKGRGWQTSKLITFHIDDEKFWKDMNNKTITPRFQDSMQVQWIYEDNKTRPQNVRVLKVISYNGVPISEPLSEKEIQKICDDKNAFLEDQEHAKSLDNKSDLLTDLPDDNENDSED